SFYTYINENDDEEIKWQISSENNKILSEQSQEEIDLEEELMS
ncbi:11438_t:CDS:1, partial [Funneliformis mosseae]